jgi:hypothetical protein
MTTEEFVTKVLHDVHEKFAQDDDYLECLNSLSERASDEFNKRQEELERHEHDDKRPD